MFFLHVDITFAPFHSCVSSIIAILSVSVMLCMYLAYIFRITLFTVLSKSLCYLLQYSICSPLYPRMKQMRIELRIIIRAQPATVIKTPTIIEQNHKLARFLLISLLTTRLSPPQLQPLLLLWWQTLLH